jgi:hypothetical protein
LGNRPRESGQSRDPAPPDRIMGWITDMGLASDD